MPLKMLALVGVACALTLPAPTPEPLDEESLTQKFSKALGVKLTDLRTLSGPTRSERSQVADLTGTTARDLDGAEYWGSTIPHPRDQRPVRVTLCRIPLEEESIGASVLVCADYSGVMVSGAVLDGETKARDGWRDFVAQRIGLPIPRPARSRSHADLEKALGGDGFVSGLVRTRKVMLDGMSALSEMGKALEHGEKPGAKQLQRARKAAGELVRLRRPLESFLGGAAKEFETHARRVEEALAEIEKAPAKSDEDHERLKEVMTHVAGTCKSCHSLVHDDLQAPLRKALKERREATGYGESLYLVGFDYYPGHDNRDHDQAVATALRRGSLLIAQLLD